MEMWFVDTKRLSYRQIKVFNIPTTDEKTQWGKTSKKIRENRFEEVVETVKDILEARDIRVEYIGFD